MANMMDYLKWRGDLSLADAPFCEVDSLLLAYIAYVNLDGIGPEGDGEVKSLGEAAQEFFQRYPKEVLEKDRSFVRLAPFLMKEMAKSRRFGDVKMRNYVSLFDQEKELQFAALELILGDGTSYIAYRGTDDHIVGWKEDFFLSNGVVPAETEAVNYLNRVGNQSGRILRLGGHSKGGNLAVYAAAECDPDVKKRLRVVYNLDGPGFTEEFLQRPGLLEIQKKIRRYIPESSMIGMLLEQPVEPIVIKSQARGILQHDGLSWEVLGPAFVKCKELSSVAVVFDKTMKSWLQNMEESQKADFINDVFAVLEAPGVDTLTELQEGGIKSIGAMWKRVDALKPETRQTMRDFLKELASHLPELLPFRGE